MMGSDDMKSLGQFKKEFGIKLDRFLEDEEPIHKVHLKGFYMDLYEVTNQDYKLFIDVTRTAPPPNWKRRMYPRVWGDNNPVIYVTWYNANAYCEWTGKRLPTEEEWERTARGPKGYKYAWGNEFDEKKAIFAQETTAPVGSMSGDKSFFGVYDMAGNVMEWTSSWYKPYPGSTKKSKTHGEIQKVARGWSWSKLMHYNVSYIFSRNSHRHHFRPHRLGQDIGFRCAKDPK